MPVFVDTNVLVYARDASEPEKRPLARAWIDHLWETRQGRLSVQVLHELYVTVTRKLQPGLTPAQARAEVDDLLAWRPEPVGPQAVRDAWAMEDRFGLSYWDALIVASARSAGCRVLLTEDLRHGQELDGLRVVDPFRVGPAELTIDDA